MFVALRAFVRPVEFQPGDVVRTEGISGRLCLLAKLVDEEYLLRKLTVIEDPGIVIPCPKSNQILLAHGAQWMLSVMVNGLAVATLDVDLFHRDPCEVSVDRLLADLVAMTTPLQVSA